MNKNSRIYVAGHTGLVGSALVNSLKSKGYTNIIGKTFEELDLRNPMAVKTFFEWSKPEYVILAAAKVGGIMANNTYRADFIYENLMIQNNVIHQSYLSGVKKLLFLGSTCIYPKDCPQPMKEEHLLTSPLEYTNEPYAIAKIAGIKMCESYNIQRGTNFISVMPTNLYGPNDNFDLEKSHVLPALIRKIYLGKCLEENNWDAIRKDFSKRPIEGINGTAKKDKLISLLKKYGITTIPSHGVTVEIWGSGKPLREFLWSEEMAAACVYIMENVNFEDMVYSLTEDTPNAKLSKNDNTSEKLEPIKIELRNTHINIGTGKETSIKKLAELVKENAHFNGKLYFNSEKPDGMMRKLTNVNKLHKLGWRHQIDIEEGVSKMYKWYIK
jgi:GDP-L-fucose synthase